MTVLFAFICLFICVAGAKAASESVRSYAHRMVLKRWHSEAEWRAFDAIIQPESHWDPCAYYPQKHDCSYSGRNSCGLAQRNPCPAWARGRLWETRYRQVEDAIAYIAGRYGSPSKALAYRKANGSY